MARFDGMETQVLGLSVDSTDCLKAWADSLGGIDYPLVSDFFPHGRVAQMYGVFRSEGYSERALFVIDKHRIIQYVDVHDIDEQPDNEVLFDELARLDPRLAARQATQQVRPAVVAAASEPEADVVMYCTPWCPACMRARTFFKEHQISVVEVDITKDRAAAQRVKNWAGGYETTPTFKVKGQVIVDWDPGKMVKILGIV